MCRERDKAREQAERMREALERIANRGEGAHRAYYSGIRDASWGIPATLPAAQRIARSALEET